MHSGKFGHEDSSHNHVVIHYHYHYSPNSHPNRYNYPDG